MAKLTKMSCPSCAGTIEKPEGKDFFHCIHCGTKVLVEDETKTRVEIKKEIISSIGAPATINCEFCGGTIFLHKDPKYICRICKKVICSMCYYQDLNACKECKINFELKRSKKKIWILFIVSIIFSFPLLFIPTAVIWFYYLPKEFNRRSKLKRGIVC